VIDEGALAHLFNLVVGLGLLAARLEDLKCTKIRQLLMHKSFALRMLGCSPMNVCQEILNKTHHSPYIVHFGSTEMYKDDERSKLEFSTYL
jgi:hypothetical protein